MGQIWRHRKKWQYFWGEIARVYVEMNLQDLAIYAYERAILVAAASQEEQGLLLGVEV